MNDKLTETEPLHSELDDAYKRLKKAQDTIKLLESQRKQDKMVIGLLDAAGYITRDKLREAMELVHHFVEMRVLKK